jgi:FtsP/CotA-like multicopper oxidase with cupredoxin domain/peroxiredoxin
MRRLSTTSRLLALALVFGLSCWVAFPLGLQGRQAKKRRDPTSKADVLSRSLPFRQPPAARNYSAKAGLVEVELVVGMTVHALDEDGDGKPTEFVRTRSYNGKLCGPVIRAKPGDLLKIRLRNDVRRTEPDTPFDKDNPTRPHGFNLTNLHTHGLNVSPEGRSDNVMLEVGPEEYVDLCFDVHKGHTCGTFWYHAHKHGSVALQLAGGMAGVLIIDGGLDEVPQIKAAMEKGREKILVFQQIPYRPEPGKVVEVSADDVYADPKTKDKDEKDGKLKRDTLINGELQPTITMRPGELQRWRCVHAGLERSLNLGLALAKVNNPEGKDLLDVYEIAIDGLPLGKVKKRPNVLLHPGYRSDLLVRAPSQPGEYLLRNLPLDKSQNVTGIAQPERFLARVKVQGDPVEMKLPTDEQVRKYRLPSIDKVDDATKEIRFYSNDKKTQFLVNDKAFEKGRPDLESKLDTAEEWTLAPQAGKHPFHIHVNPFEVIGTDENGKEERTWRDTLLVDGEAGDEVKVRMRFERYSGKTVLHCHNLRHEDQGMMANFEIKGKAGASRCPPAPRAGLKALPADAPSWELSDGKEVKKSSGYQGKKLLLVFSRGQECFHCREQIRKLEARAKDLAAAGLCVIVVVPIPAAQLPEKKSFPDAVLADGSLEAFRKYGCHDGRALHGTFLIDTTGKVRWQSAGDEPYMDVDALLTEAKGLK